MHNKALAFGFLTALCGASAAHATATPGATDGPGTGRILGPVFEHGFVVRDAIYGKSDEGVVMILSDQDGLCDDLRNGIQRRNTQYLFLHAQEIGNNESTGPVGSYRVLNDQEVGNGAIGRIATISYLENDYSCPNITDSEGIRGFLTLTKVQADGAHYWNGEFNTLMSDAEHTQVAGFYSARECQALEDEVAGARTPREKPACTDRR